MNKVVFSAAEGSSKQRQAGEQPGGQAGIRLQQHQGLEPERCRSWPLQGPAPKEIGKVAEVEGAWDRLRCTRAAWRAHRRCPGGRMHAGCLTTGSAGSPKRTRGQAVLTEAVQEAASRDGDALEGHSLGDGARGHDRLAGHNHRLQSIREPRGAKSVLWGAGCISCGPQFGAFTRHSARPDAMLEAQMAGKGCWPSPRARAARSHAHGYQRRSPMAIDRQQPEVGSCNLARGLPWRRWWCPGGQQGAGTAQPGG